MEVDDKSYEYMDQLKDLFNECDLDDKGYLSKDEFIVLCRKLKVDDHVQQLEETLISNDKNGQITFEGFKEEFMNVLAQNEDLLESSEDSLDEEDLMDSLYNKPSGREQHADESIKPDADELSLHQLSYESSADSSSPDDDEKKKKKKKSSGGTNLRSPKSKKSSGKDVDSNETARGKESQAIESESLASSQEKAAVANSEPMSKEDAEKSQMLSETYEAEGQLDQSIGDFENAFDPVSEQEHLSVIWRQLGVGADGYLNVEELGKVCKHIGMEDMEDEEVEQLFDKLDVDQDGRVSFKEFLEGLFQHGNSTSTTPIRPSSTPRQKLRLSLPNDDRGTPSFISSGCALFSMLDQQGTGYAQTDALIEFWESLAISHGIEILEYFEFDVNHKINLGDLTYCLEQEMYSVEEDNAPYRAAVVSYQHELKYLKTLIDHLNGEKLKLKQDYTEATTRNTYLVKEADDRYATLQRSKDRELSELEKRNQEQLKTLMSEKERERDIFIHQNNKKLHNFELDLEQSKSEENRLKENVYHLETEIKKLETEKNEIIEMNQDLEKINVRQQQELDTALERQRTLEELETNRAETLDEQLTFLQQKLKQRETENKELKDRLDEFTMETENLKQQLLSHRRGKGNHLKTNDKAQRTGSVLSDYHKPTIPVRRNSDSNSEYNSEPEDGKSRMQKSMQETGVQTDDIEDELAAAQALEASLSRELFNMRKGVEKERQDLEEYYRNEIAKLEDEILKERDEWRETIDEEKEATRQEVIDEVQTKHDKEKERLRLNLQEVHDIEVRELIVKVESEKNLMQIKMEEEKAQIIQKLKTELDEEHAQNKLKSSASVDQDEREAELKDQITRLQQSIDILANEKESWTGQVHSMDEEITELKQNIERLHKEKTKREKIVQNLESKIDQLENSISSYDEQLENKSHKEKELKKEIKKLKELSEMNEDVHAEEIKKVKLLMKKAVKESEEQLSLMTVNDLSGRLKEEFEELLDRRVDLETQAKLAKHDAIHQEAKDQLAANFENDVMELSTKLKRETQESEAILYQKISSLKSQLKELEDARENELDVAKKQNIKQYRSQLLDLEQQLEDAQRSMKINEKKWRDAEERSRDAEKRCQDAEERYQIMKAKYKELDSQLITMDSGQLHSRKVEEKLRKSIGDEYFDRMDRLKSSFNEERQALEQRIEQLQRQLKQQEQAHIDQEQTRSELDQCKAKVSAQSGQIKEIQGKLLKAQEDLRRSEEEQRRIRNEKQEEVKAIRSELLEAMSPSGGNNVRDSDKLILEAISGMKSAIESSNSDLSREIHQSLNSSHLQSDQKAELTSALDRMEQHMADTLNMALRGESNRSDDQSETERKLQLTQEQLVETENKLAASETSLALSKAAQARELVSWTTKMGNMVDPGTHHQVQSQLEEARRQLLELQSKMEERIREMNKSITNAKQDHEHVIKKYENDNDMLLRQIKQLEALLEKQTEKLKVQLRKTNKSDKLVRDLYIENAELMQTLCETEKRQKEAFKRAYNLEEKCVGLQSMVSKITLAAM